MAFGLPVSNPGSFPSITLPERVLTAGSLPHDMVEAVHEYEIVDEVLVNNQNQSRERGLYAFQSAQAEVETIETPKTAYKLRVFGPNLQDVATLRRKILAGEIAPCTSHEQPQQRDIKNEAGQLVRRFAGFVLGKAAAKLVEIQSGQGQGPKAGGK